MNRKKIFITGAHVLFCLLFVGWFYTNSFIRPYAIFYPYKEIISALLVLFIIYLNYLILIPYFIRRSYYKGYIFLSLLLLVVLSIAELQLVKNDILGCIELSSNGLLSEKRIYLLSILLMLVLRNSGFYLFFTILRLYELTKANALIEKKEALNQDGLILLLPLQGKPISINIKYVSYFSHERNQTFIHGISSEAASIYFTLNNIQEYLGDNCLRVNKENIITFTNIISYNKDEVVVKNGKGNKQRSLTYYKKDAQNILSVLRKKVPDLEEKNAINSQKMQDGGIKEDEKNDIGGINALILDEIRNDPCISVVTLAQKLKGKSSLRTIERKLEELKKSGYIKFEGSKKTGGYYFVERKDRK
ncbi:MAG: LytTR family transcriptional regulator DNA-binding domain-containing protein [Firmicutes bacterium]|nr:LytTR family transcriptional regulator DNA-binding domain-containing protein [Bacillota bacterium]